MSEQGPEWWQTISPYLDQLLELEVEERLAWLTSLRERNPSLATHLEELLREHELADEHFLEQGPVLPLPVSPAQVGQAVGAYTLLSLIGEGGMGSVWLAERSDGRFRRRAAVKFLRAPLGGLIGQERFKREGSILGRLAHPHIAELLDAGVSSGGQPYLILEYVDGEPIDAYCDQRRLDVEARVRLFLDVLAGVAHAHTNLIVHRDLKPSNVLVRSDGQVKLLDFGVAKLLEDEGQAGAATQLTREGGSALTLEYAAPEQVAGDPVTTATDVYAAGVLFYLLLTGYHPAGSGPHPPADLVRTILEIEPLRPSDAVLRTKAGPQITLAHSEARATTPERLSRLLRGDLDTIAAKALKKDPTERYASVTAFADDLRRCLDKQPISARPDTLAYRAAKFVRRNRTSVTLTATAMTLVIGSLSAGLYVANRQRAVAEQRFAQLRELSKNVFDVDNSLRHLPGSTESRQRLVSAALQYLGGLSAGRSSDPDLLEDVAEGYWRVARIQGVPIDANLGQPTKAEANLEKAEELNEKVLAARSHSHSALLLSANILEDRMILAQEAHRNTDALACASRAAERLDTLVHVGRLQDLERRQMALIYSNIALANLNMHLYPKAIFYARQSVSIGRPVPSAKIVVAGALSLLSSALRYQGDLEGALQAILKARKLSETSVAPLQVRSFDDYGILMREGLLLAGYDSVGFGHLAEAVEPLQKAFDIEERMAEKDRHDATSRTRVATSGNALGNVLLDRDPKRALAVYELALKRIREVPDSQGAWRSQAKLLTNSSYPLRRLHRSSEASNRIAMATALLRKTKDYPTEKIRLDSDAYVVYRAQADDEAERGNPRRAAELYEQLLAHVLAARPVPLSDLEEAARLSNLYEALTKVYRQAGEQGKEERTKAQRLALWTRWNRELPNNAFVHRQLQAAGS